MPGLSHKVSYHFPKSKLGAGVAFSFENKKQTAEDLEGLSRIWRPRATRYFIINIMYQFSIVTAK